MLVKQMDEDVKRRAKIKSDMPTSALDMCHTEQSRYWAQIGNTTDALALSEVFDTHARDARSPLAYSY